MCQLNAWRNCNIRQKLNIKQNTFLEILSMLMLINNSNNVERYETVLSVTLLSLSRALLRSLLLLSFQLITSFIEVILQN